MKNEEYSELSLQITKELDKKVKKEYGIFITPKTIIEKLMTRIHYYIKTLNIVINNILEPACGTCEIINHLNNQFQNVNITGVEINSFIYERIKDIEYQKNNTTLLHKNFIQFNSETNYDLIITNPPYFVCSKNDIPQEYKEYVNGRPNIFGLFILHSIQILNPGGILAFIIPRSFLNAIYYGKIRDYIKEVCDILEIIDFEKDNKFIDTQQSTFGLIIQKKKLLDMNIILNKTCNYSMKIGENFIFTCDLTLLKKLFEGSTTLTGLNLRVKTGNIVWNEHKDILSHDTDYSLLIYNSNIGDDNKVMIKQFNNDEKKQYIQMIGFNEYPVMVVNRGNGNSKYNLKYAIVDMKKKYMVENHLNVIYPKCNNISKEELLEKYNKVVKSFKNQKTKEFINLFLGNNGLSKTELETIFPIYI